MSFDNEFKYAWYLWKIVLPWLKSYTEKFLQWVASTVVNMKKKGLPRIIRYRYESEILSLYVAMIVGSEKITFILFCSILLGGHG